ncbi:AbgT family transporter [Zhongshania aliphaticivorans]|uniref:AbgT family transporter n=1 Tax=Zhongshania aliphaticivorans TaxID=1470434 RepID=UPI0012E644B8|nr:AbgT family transporter [Zhongshania aliphaticivorans]CAA0079089.1 p-aminobenzoyl-glutamate transport protein [Zhongshania aliphaticivorans]
MNNAKPAPPFIQRWLNSLELAGNRLPNPVLLFIYFCIAIVTFSVLAEFIGFSAQHPLTNDVITAKSLLSAEGIKWMVGNAVGNFIHFAPVGSVLVAILGIAVAEDSGLLSHVLQRLAASAPPRLLSSFVVFAGVMSSIGFDSGYVVLIPLAALIFRAAGRSPLAGIAAAFAGVSGGYSANLLLGPVDAILSGISSEAMALVAPEHGVLTSGNYYFTLVSTAFITVTGAWVNEKVVEPRLAKPNLGEFNDESQQRINTPILKAAIRKVAIFSVAFLLLLLWLVIPADGLMRNPDPKGLAALPLLNGIVVFIALYATLSGLIFGYSTGKYKRHHDWIAGMENGIGSLSGYIVLMFFAAQFVNYFNWTGLGAISAINGANWLAGLELSKTSLLVGFILISASINLLIGSASAKWALMAPIFIPMLFLLGIDPESAQMAYRIGDSSTNIITPLMPYFGVVVAFMQRHDESAGMGTLMALMLPYSVIFLVAWSLLLSLWLAAGLPLGPG